MEIRLLFTATLVTALTQLTTATDQAPGSSLTLTITKVHYAPLKHALVVDYLNI